MILAVRANCRSDGYFMSCCVRSNLSELDLLGAKLELEDNIFIRQLGIAVHRRDHPIGDPRPGDGMDGTVFTVWLFTPRGRCGIGWPLIMPNLLNMCFERRPVNKSVTASDGMLSVGEFPPWILPPKHSQNVLGLFLQMVQVWVGW